LPFGSWAVIAGGERVKVEEPERHDAMLVAPASSDGRTWSTSMDGTLGAHRVLVGCVPSLAAWLYGMKFGRPRP
jgi:hypothetical protein